MADERLYTIPLRREFLKVARYKRAKKAVKAVRDFIQKHMKVEEVKIGINLNELLWSKGIKNPPTRVKIKTKKEEGYALVELAEFPFQTKIIKEEKKNIAEKILGKKEVKSEEVAKEEAKKEAQKELKKELEKEEIKQQKKEHEGHHKMPGEPERAMAKEEIAKEKMSKVIRQTGKKESHEAKP
ncbi:50S ribosomal protein L31e [Candidatus Woesearchaeota archaeon]|nr:50S ribosomal protein L31e [Candidatus Woesearchaeota archaeon]